jgi:hypothetical protein
VGITGLIFGLLGFFAMVWGILVAVEVVPVFFKFDQSLSLLIAGVLTLLGIACLMGRGQGGGEY